MSMYISQNTLDDLLHEILTTLLDEQQVVKATKGEFRELFGCCLHLKNPRARLSRSESKGKVFSALGELFWYLSGDTRLDFIDYYVPGRFHEESDDKVRVRSGYGDRLNSFRGMNQLQNVIDLLKEKPTSRRAVIQLFDATDLTQHYASIPCTCTLQFLARDSRLHLFVSMRSNDAFIGLPHDIFSFTMLQEIVARSVGLEVGEYKHCAGSLHLYDHDIDRARSYLNERWQSSISMPPMPQGDPWESIKELQHIEESFRLNQLTDIDSSHLGEYWKDLARLMHAFRSTKDKNTTELASVIDSMHSDVYKMFAQARLDTLTLPN